MIKARYLCRERDFESPTVRDRTDNTTAQAAVIQHLQENTDHIIDIVLVWEA